MPSLKDVKVKITGVGKTRQITKAMNMVASAKLRGAQSRIERFRPYAEKFQDILGDLAGKADGATHPLLTPHASCTHTLIVLITSDRGLCGSLNVSLIARALDVARTSRVAGKTVSFICVGKKGRDAVRKTDFELHTSYTDQLNNLDFTLASLIGKEILSEYTQLTADEVIVVYPIFKSLATQVPASLALLPINSVDKLLDEEALLEDGLHAHAETREYVYEPTAGQLLGELLPRFINVQVYRTLLDASASEHAARMTAMDNATRNCDDMISTLTLLYNKTRQAAITTDLMDIVGGAEALNG